MTAQEWREKAGLAARKDAVELELPSGMKILARRPDPVQLVAWGKLPTYLVGKAAGAVGEAPDADLMELGQFLRDLLSYCCVEPRVPEDVEPREIPREDWLHILHWAMRVEEVRALEGFRGGGGDAGGGGDGADVRAAAERAAGNQG